MGSLLRRTCDQDERGSVEVHTILVVEDDPDINALLSRIMTREGFCTAQAYSGTEALLHLERAAFDLVLLDMMLPGMDGRSLLVHLRDNLGIAIPIIVVSAKAGLSDKVDLLALGADDYIVSRSSPTKSPRACRPSFGAAVRRLRPVALRLVACYRIRRRLRIRNLGLMSRCAE